MMDILNEYSVLLTLQSMTRDRLFPVNPTEAMGLAGMPPEEFGATGWADLGFSTADSDALRQSLEQMFPSATHCPGGECPLAVIGGINNPASLARNIFAGWLAGNREIVYQSSGSSGKPKFLPHSYDAVRQEVDCLAGLFPHVRHIIGVTPQHHCYGFVFGVLMHARLGVPYTVLPALPTVIRHTLLSGEYFGDSGGQTLLIGYPDLWSRICLPDGIVPKNLLCLSAGAPWADDSIRQVYLAGYQQLLEIYGSSENGAMGYRWGSEKPGDFHLLEYWSLARQHPAPEKSQEYLLRQLPSGMRIPCPIQDELAWSSERSFRPLRRRDNAVQVSGINVYPEHSALVIATHPYVLTCRVRQMRPEEGCRLKAFVVPQPGIALDVLRRELKGLCRQRLSAPERPVHFTFGSSVPKNDFGKETDWKELPATPFS